MISIKGKFEKLYLLVLDDFEKRYSHLRNKKIGIFDLKKDSYKFKKVKTEQEFRKMLGQELKKFKDVHIAVFGNNRKRIYAYKKRVEKNYDEETLRNYFKKFDFENSSIRITKKKNTLYLLIKTWSHKNGKELIEGLEYLKKQIKKGKIKKIIFDVRQNEGGSSFLASKYIELLIKKGKEVPIFKAKTTINKIPKLEKIKTIKVKGNLGFDGKVIALMGQKSCSSTELFLLALREIKAVLIGDKSRGSSGNPLEYRYGDTIVRIPSWISYNIKGEAIEDNPIQPDIKISSRKSIFKKRDLPLEKALKI